MLYRNLSIEFENKALGPWHHPYYPIFLNQGNADVRGDLRELTFKYRVLHFGIPIDHRQFRVEFILRYGQTPNTVPEPKHGYRGGVTGSPARKILEESEHSYENVNSTLVKLKVHPSFISEGGFESTIRLRMVLLHPQADIVLAFCDSDRFVIMTRDLPSQHRLHTYLAEWGFPIHPSDYETRGLLDNLNANRTRKLPEPMSYPYDDEEDDMPESIQLPCGKSMPTIYMFQNMQKTLDLGRRMNLLENFGNFGIILPTQRISNLSLQLPPPPPPMI